MSHMALGQRACVCVCVGGCLQPEAWGSPPSGSCTWGLQTTAEHSHSPSAQRHVLTLIFTVHQGRFKLLSVCHNKANGRIILMLRMMN